MSLDFFCHELFAVGLFVYHELTSLARELSSLVLSLHFIFLPGISKITYLLLAAAQVFLGFPPACL
jgi:hypothetical protein